MAKRLSIEMQAASGEGREHDGLAGGSLSELHSLSTYLGPPARHLLIEQLVLAACFKASRK